MAVREQDLKKDLRAAQKLRVFISYSRRDRTFADRLVAALELHDIEVIIDRRDLPLLEEWQNELIGFIRKADAIVYLLSPSCDQLEMVQMGGRTGRRAQQAACADCCRGAARRRRHPGGHQQNKFSVLYAT